MLAAAIDFEPLLAGDVPPRMCVTQWLAAGVKAPDLGDGLKQACHRALHADPAAAERALNALDVLAETVDDDAPALRALALRTRADYHTIATGRYAVALPLYERAAAIYHAIDDPVALARMNIARIWALSFTDDGYAGAVALGAEAFHTLEAHQQARSLAILVGNMAMVHNRFGAFHESLGLLEAAERALSNLGAEGVPHLARNASNRAFVLYMLGDCESAIEAAEKALRLAESHGQTVVVGHARHNLGTIHYAMGNYGAALAELSAARTIWLDHARYQDVVQCDLTAAYCHFELQRPARVLEACRTARELAAAHGVQPETPRSFLIEPLALAQLGRFDDAAAALDALEELIGGSAPIRTAEIALVRARLQHQQGAHAAAFVNATSVAATLATLGRPALAAHAHAVAARSAEQDGHHDDAGTAAATALRLAESHNLFPVIYNANAILGRLARAAGDRITAAAHFRAARDALGRLQRAVAVEMRAEFLAESSKQQLYADSVSLALEAGDTRDALRSVEEAKSRALLDLVADRVSLRLTPRSPADEALVDTFNALRVQRDRLYRAAQIGGAAGARLAEQQNVEERILRIREALLLRNGTYGQVLALDSVQVIDAQPHLSAKSALVEYFIADDELLAFVLLPGDAPPAVVRLSADLTQLTRWLNAFHTNCHVVTRLPASRVPALTHSAQRLLEQLYDALFAPVQPWLGGAQHVYIVPHGQLHYVPFHALYGNSRYAGETHTVSYLPASTLLAHPHAHAPSASRALAIAHTYAGRLPRVTAEARRVLDRWPGALLAHEDATRDAVLAQMASADILHFATHGEFSRERPLFSGLALEDGWLTALDIMNVRLRASLVTLSGCHTGTSAVGGGDELLGLLRAFLAAGARSLLLTHWAIEDRAAEQFMDAFYAALAAGHRKAAAVQMAQQSLRNSAAHLEHPYFWAPFYLVGDPGPARSTTQLAAPLPRGE